MRRRCQYRNCDLSEDGAEIDRLMSAADNAMYESKAGAKISTHSSGSKRMEILPLHGLFSMPLIILMFQK